MTCDDPHRGRLVDRLRAGQHLERHEPEAVQVARRTQTVTADLLRRHVARRANQDAVGGQLFDRRGFFLDLHQLCDSEIEHLDQIGLVEVVVHHDVLRFDVAVQNVEGVSLVQATKDLLHDMHHTTRLDRSRGGDEVLHRLTVDILQRHVQQPAVGASVIVDDDRVRTAEFRDDLRLAPKPLFDLLDLSERLLGRLLRVHGGAHHLDRDQPLQVFLDRAVDPRKASGPEDRFYSVPSEEEVADAGEVAEVHIGGRND